MPPVTGMLRARRLRREGERNGLLSGRRRGAGRRGLTAGVQEPSCRAQGFVPGSDEDLVLFYRSHKCIALCISIDKYIHGYIQWGTKAGLRLWGKWSNS